MQQSSSAQDHADQVLHDQLLAAQQHLQSQGQDSRQPTSQQGHNIDPAISGGAMLAPHTQASSLVLPQVMSGVQEAAGGGDASRKTYGKRELSTSKRAEQNRAAQRAFRQRKEGYIRQLESQVKDYKVLSESYKALQAENYQLREYIISLQSRLIDSQNEVPALPDNIDLTQPRPEPPLADSHQQQAESSPPSSVSIAPPPHQQQPSQAQQQRQQQQHTLAAAPTQIPPLAPHQHPHQPSTAPSNTTNEDLGQLNRIAVAGLGMRKHAHPDTVNNNNNNHNQNSNQNSRDHYMPEDSYPWKRPRGNDGYVDRNSADVKIEAVHGLPSIS
ncbi:putative transcription factor kapC [Talaromyces pinophilus]|nr:putative transcription factor kapC [Talaromyces pinophilus]